MNYSPPSYKDNTSESLRLEAVTVCVEFDDMLDESLKHNMAHVDTMIVITNHNDRKTQQIARKHGAICVQTDLFRKNGRVFNKGASINAGFGRFQYSGWRLHIDSDIVLPDSFRRMVFNHSHLDRSTLYGADRTNVYGKKDLDKLFHQPQHLHSTFMAPNNLPLCPRFVSPIYGYVPIGFFQMWHASTQKEYPYGLGTAEHDDVMFGISWPESHRKILPTVVVYHLCSKTPTLGENWDGKRRMPRLK